jgi:hypothetical protein
MERLSVALLLKKRYLFVPTDTISFSSVTMDEAGLSLETP